MELSLKNYSNILKNVQKIIQKTQENINQSVNQEKVLMSWEIGKIIEEFLSSQSQYGLQLINQLELDTAIKKNTLYQMRNFYNSYPHLQKSDITLNWTHYRTLITIKDSDERQYFENLALENNLNSRDLTAHIANQKQQETVPQTVAKKAASKLYPKRGELFHYKLDTVAGSSKTFIDCGFKIFTEIDTHLTPPLQVVSTKDKTGAITLQPTLVNKAKFYTYKAYLEKVVDGDTLRVVLDLGFGLRHKEIVRLRGINAPEIKTANGLKSAAALKEILKDVTFLVVKTNQVDIYGRYVADVFFEVGEMNAQKVAAKGVYLNNLLLSQGLAELY